MNTELLGYIKENILPVYEKNDGGHGISHIEYVIRRSLEFMRQFEGADENIVYTVAACHDLAHHIDRKRHEELSAQMFMADAGMRRFFTDEERVIIKEAIEDHRASGKSEPRSIYGRIVSSADRSTDAGEFITRAHAYTLKHFPGLTDSEIIERAYTHTKEKYGENGYARHYCEDPEYDAFRKKITELLADRAEFERYYISVTGVGKGK